MASNRMTIAYVRDGTLNVTVPELYKLDRKQLYDLVGKRIFENANRRVRNIRTKKDLYSKSVYDVMHSGGLFSARGKDKEQLINEIRRANNFLLQQDSTVRGAKQYTADVNQRTPNLTAGEKKIMWDIYRNIEANHPIYMAELKRKSGYYGDSHKLVRYVETIVKQNRALFPSGLAGDLISATKKEIRATAGERARAIEEIKAYFRHEIAQYEKQIARSQRKSLSVAYTDAVEFLKNGEIDIELI